MATVNFSIPEDVKREFNKVFDKENKSAILTKLMRQAIAEKKRQLRRQAVIEKILELRSSQNPIATEEIEQARTELRS